MNMRQITIDGVTYALTPVTENKAGPAICRIGNPEWSATLCDGKNVTHADAEKACTALGEGWRLPTRIELESILDLTRHEPAIDTTRFPDTKNDWYWTSTLCAWSSDRAWCVGFGYGSVSGYHRGNADACVRAVRSVPETHDEH